MSSGGRVGLYGSANECGEPVSRQEFFLPELVLWRRFGQCLVEARLVARLYYGHRYMVAVWKFMHVLWSKKGNGLGEGVAESHPSGHSSRFLLAPPSIPASVVARKGSDL